MSVTQQYLQYPVDDDITILVEQRQSLKEAHIDIFLINGDNHKTSVIRHQLINVNDEEIDIMDIIRKIEQNGFNLSNALIQYYDQNLQEFQDLGVIPFCHPKKVVANNYSKEIQIKYFPQKEQIFSFENNFCNELNDLSFQSNPSINDSLFDSLLSENQSFFQNDYNFVQQEIIEEEYPEKKMSKLFDIKTNNLIEGLDLTIDKYELQNRKNSYDSFLDLFNSDIQVITKLDQNQVSSIAQTFNESSNQSQIEEENIFSFTENSLENSSENIQENNSKNNSKNNSNNSSENTTQNNTDNSTENSLKNYYKNFQEHSKTKFDKLKVKRNLKVKVNGLTLIKCQTVLNQVIKPGRPKERTIKNVRDQVFKWRRIYRQGKSFAQKQKQQSLKEKGKCQKKKKISLSQAAAQVGLSKKSLDDYILHIRYGAKFGFDFKKNQHEKIGKLRSFTRKHKKQVLEGIQKSNYKKFLKKLPFTTTTLTNDELSLLTDLKPVKNHVQ